MQSNLTRLALSGALALTLPVMPASASLILHNTMDNVDVGAGLGTDTTADGRFDVRDTAGVPQNGSAGSGEGGGATTSAHVTSGAVGQIGEALSFPSDTGSNRGVAYGDVLNPGTGSYTVSLWFNAMDTTGTEYLAGKGNTGSTIAGWSIVTVDDTIGVRVGIGGSGGLDRASMTDTFTAGVFHQVALVIDNSAGELFGYLDGALMSTIGGFGPTDNLFAPGSNFTTTASMRLGINSSNAGEYQGFIDDFAIFDEALSAADIAGLYQDGLAGINAAGVGPGGGTVPEPATWLLGGIGLLGLLLVQRRAFAGGNPSQPLPA